MTKLLETYHSLFGKSDTLYQIFSPYRICPLGAHVDHQHGLVSGFAFDKGIDLLFSVSDTEMIEMCSLSFEGLVTFNISYPLDEKQGNWGDYLRGSVYALKKRYRLEKGIRGVIQGNMPIGGLSSSAAALVGYVMALAKANDIILSDMEVIQIASEAEREYVGLRNGILDQACVVLCQKDGLLYLDTETNEHKILPVHPSAKPFEIGIFFSGVTRSLVSTDYNLRVSECKTAAWIMEAYEKRPLKNMEETFLRDVPEELYYKAADKMPDRFRRRAAHFYSECERVRQGVQAWQEGNIDRFGKLIFKSCESSIYNYECGSGELITLYHAMLRTKGIYGGRFSGAGFKGACIALVDPRKKKSIRESITSKYLAEYPQYKDSFEVFFCKLDSGARFV